MEENNTKVFIVTEDYVDHDNSLTYICGVFTTIEKAQDKMTDLAILRENELRKEDPKSDYYGEWMETGEWRYMDPDRYIVLSIEESTLC